MSRSLDKFLPLLIGLCAFLLVTGGLMLWPSNIAWFGGGDPLQHYLGWAFFRGDEWRFPLGLNPHFGLELGSAIAFSDSLPLLALPFKALSPWLTPTFQYFGLWVLVCFVLQAVLAWKIAGLATEDRWSRAAMAAIMAIAPPMIWRLHGHISLFSHFLILAALYFYAVSRTKRRPVAFALLVAVSTLVHAYLAVMVAAIWLASLSDGWLRQGARLRACFGELALGLTLSAFAAWQAGYFSVGKGTASGGYGIYRMNLLSLFDADGWSHVLPDIPGGWGDYEGFNYLGLGLLALLVVNLPFAVSDLRTLSARIGRSPFLALVALGLTVFAVTNVVGFGAFSFELPLPTQLEGIANTFRSSGRMFWPVFYLIAFWLLFATLRNWGERRGRWLLLLALGLQVWDTSAGWAFRPRLLSPPSAELTLPMTDPFWEEAAKRYAKVRWVLPMNKSPHWETVATYALRHGMATDATYLARIGSDALASAVATARHALDTGVYETDSLYLLDDASARTAFETLRPGDMLAKIDDFIMLAPGWMTCETCEKSYRLDASALFGPLKVNEPIRLGKNDGAKIYLGSGWGEQEDWGVWTGDDTARIGFADPLPAHFRLTLQARAFGPNIGADVEVVAGNSSATFRLTPDLGEVNVELDPSVATNHLSLRVPHAVSPAELGINGDIRRLGIGVAWFEITPLQP